MAEAAAGVGVGVPPISTTLSLPQSGQLEPAFAHYKRALAINPTHLGAHEYMGEAYLMAGKPDQAEYHLRELARICAASCEEYADLKQAIAQVRGKPAGTASRFSLPPSAFGTHSPGFLE